MRLKALGMAACTMAPMSMHGTRWWARHRTRPAAAEAAAIAERPVLGALTSLRFWAALWVVFHHFWPRVQGVHGEAPLHRILDHLAAQGFVGVTVFFVLSGFLLTYTYPRPSPGMARAFYRARWARIYPMYLLALACALPLLVADVQALQAGHGAATGLLLGIAKAGMVLLLVQAWWPGAAQFWNSPAWSLSAEAFFYLLFPWLATGMAHGGPRRATVVLALGVALSLGSGLVLWGVHRAFPHLDTYAVIGLNPLLRLPEFLAGVALGRLYLADRWPRAGTWLALLALGWIGIGLGSGLVPAELAAAHTLPGAVLLIGALARGGALARLGATRALVALGESSYALYLLQVPLAAVLLPAAISWPRWVAYLVALQLLALAAQRLYEQPMRRRWRGAVISKA